jgi:hypothetical protein
MPCRGDHNSHDVLTVRHFNIRHAIRDLTVYSCFFWGGGGGELLHVDMFAHTSSLQCSKKPVCVAYARKG